MTLASNIQTISTALDDIKDAIEAKGVTPTGDITTYATAIGNIEPTLVTKTITNNGTYLAENDDADGYSSVTVNVAGGSVDSGGAYLVRVVDYDGTILKQDHLNQGATFTMPNQPTHSGLTFSSWQSPVTITNNTLTVGQGDIIIGATYTITSGNSEFDITLADSNNLTVTLYMNGTKNWGDGTTDTNRTHTYAATGDYTITCTGDAIDEEDIQTDGGLFAQQLGGNNAKWILKKARLTNITNIDDSMFAGLCCLSEIVITSTISRIGENAFQGCNSLKAVVCPNSVNDISEYWISDAQLLRTVIYSNSNSFDTSTYPYNIVDTSNLETVNLPLAVTSVPKGYCVDNPYLKILVLPSNVTQIGEENEDGCFHDCKGLTKVKCLGDITSIYGNSFSSNPNAIEYDFTACTNVPSIESDTFVAGTDLNPACKIKVPASLYNSWIAGTYWEDIANHIVGV